MEKLVDTHSHIYMIENDEIEKVVSNSIDFGVEKIIVPSAYAKDFSVVIELTKKYENVYGMLGIHPTEAKDWSDGLFDVIKDEVARNKKMVAIGEVGLDYYWDTSFKELQKEVFIKQIRLANELGLPLNVHDREAHKDTFDILQEYNKGSEVILHCFSGSVEFALECVKKGYYIGLGGVVTFKNAIKMKEVAVQTPLDKLLVETDAPYLAPVPYRGKENQPAYVKLVAEEIAKLRGISFDEVARITTENAERVYGL
ncbi:MAG: TatD family hydrolase [Candidatus Gastranaerophilales bacterium]